MTCSNLASQRTQPALRHNYCIKINAPLSLLFLWWHRLHIWQSYRLIFAVECLLHHSQINQSKKGKKNDSQIIFLLGAFELIKDESVAGKCLWITNRRGMEYWPTSMEERKYLVNPLKSQRGFSYAAHSKLEIPHTFEKM